MGLDVGELLARALRMQHACAPACPCAENPGLRWARPGRAGRLGRDKLTCSSPEPIAALGMWLEQLLAESTGKEGKGILPVAGEPLGAPDGIRQRPVFVHFPPERHGRCDPGAAGATYPSGRPPGSHASSWTTRCDLARSSSAGRSPQPPPARCLAINPFDQPNVQESKDNTNRLLEAFRHTGELPGQAPALTGRSAAPVCRPAGRQRRRAAAHLLRPGPPRRLPGPAGLPAGYA